MRRDIVWERLDRPGLEHLALDADANGIRVESLVLLDLEAGLVRLRYRLDIDTAWRTRTASFHLDQGTTSRSLDVRRDGAGWVVDGKPRDDLAGAADIDISATPLTNTMAVRQLGVAPGEKRTFLTVYVRVPELAVSAMDQDYTRLDPAEPPRRFNYASPGFTSDVAFDAEGLVENYPPGWRRRTL
ncbi:MAG: hypothetical protein FJX54_00795 [Alphaproteobacteria bacterium]|nr:hypothetical protein [Alphaproteobacteria bacterium]